VSSKSWFTLLSDLEICRLYYESCFRYVDFWRLTVSASLACQILVTCNPIDWTSERGDLIKRAYWHCVIIETYLHLELDLPLTGIIGLADRVGMPNFSSPICESDHSGDQSSHFEAYFTSHISLQRLCIDFHNNNNDSMTDINTPASSNEDFDGLTAGKQKGSASKLEKWRSKLLKDLQWPEDDRTAFPQQSPSESSSYNQQLDPLLYAPIQRQLVVPLFTTNLVKEPIYYPYAFDTQVALLRTRYYYARYTVYRPFVYKALHFPEQMTQEDMKGVAECLMSCIKWPLTLSSTSRRKRLIPFLFCWSQNFLGILLILYLTRHSPMLLLIRHQLCGARFETDVEQSIDLMLDWIRDLKDSDPVALWCYNILQGIYKMDQ